MYGSYTWNKSEKFNSLWYVRTTSIMAFYERGYFKSIATLNEGMEKQAI